MSERPLQVFASCRMRDVEIMEIAARKLPEMMPLKKLFVGAPDRECAKIQRRLGSLATVLSEDTMIPGVTMAQMRALPMEGFPGGAGWYFQQLLKLQFAYTDLEDDYYLIWDADTVPLRRMRFFDESGRMLLTRAEEHHAAYFETYRRLLGEEPNREFSFIAQHMLVQKSIAREMLGRIEEHIPGDDNWAWKIMRTLPPQGYSLFSEYESYGHYVKKHHPGLVQFIDRPWRRAVAHWEGCPVPREGDLRTLAMEYDYAAFERAGGWWRRWARRMSGWWR